MTKYEITIEINHSPDSWDICKKIMEMAKAFNPKFTWKEITNRITYDHTKRE